MADKNNPFKRLRETPEFLARQRLAPRLLRQSKLMPEIKRIAHALTEINDKFHKLSSRDQQLEIETLRNLLATWRGGSDGIFKRPLSHSTDAVWTEYATRSVERFVTESVSVGIRDFIGFLEDGDFTGDDGGPGPADRDSMLVAAKDELRLLHEDEPQ